LPSNVSPPPGSRRVPQVLSGERLGMSRHEVSAFEEERKITEAQDRVRKLYGTGLHALAGDKSEYAQSRMNGYIKAVGDLAEATARAAKKKQGLPDAVVDKAGKLARQVAETEAKAEFAREPEPEGGVVDDISRWIQDRYRETFGDEKAKEVEEAVREADRLVRERESKVVRKKMPQGQKKTGKKPNIKTAR
jgi:hypothetical protein